MIESYIEKWDEILKDLYFHVLPQNVTTHSFLYSTSSLAFSFPSSR
jgi:hypothetical protein